MSVKIRSDESYLDWNATGKDRIVQNVRNLLRTKKYDVPFMREMGINTDVLDNPSNVHLADIFMNVKKLIETYEPRATFIDCSVEENNGDMVLIVEVEV